MQPGKLLLRLTVQTVLTLALTAALLLGSVLGLLMVPLLIAGLAPRAVFEERMLERDLPGYGDYMRRVRYRLLPLIW